MKQMVITTESITAEKTVRAFNSMMRTFYNLDGMNQFIKSTNCDLHTQYDMDNLNTIITNENLIHNFKTPVWFTFKFEPALHA